MSAKDLTAQIEQISGSASFKKDYDVCEAAKAAADEQMSFVFSKKKAVVAEKRQKKEQKEEAEKHIRMQEELVSRHANFCESCSQNRHCGVRHFRSMFAKSRRILRQKYQWTAAVCCSRCPAHAELHIPAEAMCANCRTF